MEARIAIEGRDDDVESLWDWLRHEPELRGRLRIDRAASLEGAMGTATEFVVQTVAASGAGVMIALARSLSVWLVQRRSDLTVKVSGPDGRQVSVSAQRISDPEQLLRAVLEPTLSKSAGEAVEPNLTSESHTT